MFSGQDRGYVALMRQILLLFFALAMLTVGNLRAQSVEPADSQTEVVSIETTEQEISPWEFFGVVGIVGLVSIALFVGLRRPSRHTIQEKYA